MDGSTKAHNTAVALRVQRIQEMFPGARVTTARWANKIPGASKDGKGRVGEADIICWDCDPDTIYVWEVKSEKEAARVGPTRDQLERYRAGLERHKESDVALGFPLDRLRQVGQAHPGTNS